MRLRNVTGAGEELSRSEFVIDNPTVLKGRWHELFGNDNPIHLEIGMGKGQFLLTNAVRHPSINYIGVEMYSSVLIRAAQKAESLKASLSDSPCDIFPHNFRFIRCDARLLPDYFEKDEIGKIYLNFSDPWPKNSTRSRRLTSVEFLNRYVQFLSPGGDVEFKTDNDSLFDFSLFSARQARWQIVYCTRNLYMDPQGLADNIATEYEEKFAGKGIPIKKLIISSPLQD